MLQKPYDETFLWKSQLRKSSKQNTIRQPPMVLPKCNTLTGRYIPEKYSIQDDLNYRYSLYSKKYWEGVKKRQLEYRARLGLDDW